MNDAIMYFLKVNIAIALFYLFYRLVFYKDTFWAARRFYLVFAILLSALHPLISLGGWLEKQEPVQVMMASYVQLQEITVTATPASFWTMENILLATYAFVSFLLLVRMCVQLISIVRWKLKGKKQTLFGTEIVALEENITPFSFFNSIFMNPMLHTEQETLQILTHEKTHARQGHSIDVLLSEMLTIICWLNPAAWLLKREMRQNLEFLADNSVLKSGFDSKNYQYHLLQLSYQTPEINLVNKFNISPLKKRITMMNQRKSSKAGILKYSLIVPLALALVLSSNTQSLVASAKRVLSPETGVSEVSKNEASQVLINALNEVPITETVQQDSIAETPNIQTPKVDKNPAWDVVEKMPEFPGGDSELIKYIGKSVKYPADAQAKGIQGKIVVRFIVNKIGKVEKAQILRSLDPECDKEALRVVNGMPQFIPGEQNGKKVSVYYTLPIVFGLDAGNSSSSQGKNPNIGVEYGDKNYNNSGVAPKVKGFDPNNPPAIYVNEKLQSKDFDIHNIKPETIKSIDVYKDKGTVKITLKDYSHLKYHMD